MILSFETPKKLRSAEKHNEMYQSNAGVNGTYVPNMSKEDMNLWKAKHIKGSDDCLEWDHLSVALKHLAGYSRLG